MVRIDPVVKMVTQNYIKSTITIRPDKDNQVFTFKQVKDFCEKKFKTLPPDTKIVVKGLNILRDTTLRDLMMILWMKMNMMNMHVEKLKMQPSLISFTISQ